MRWLIQFYNIWFNTDIISLFNGVLILFVLKVFLLFSFIYLCIYMCMCLYMCVYIYVLLYTRVHAHTHTFPTPLLPACQRPCYSFALWGTTLTSDYPKVHCPEGEMLPASLGPNSYSTESEDVNKHVYTFLHVIVLTKKSIGLSNRGLTIWPIILHLGQLHL